MNTLGLLIFARAPVAGEAKTRLIPVLGAQGAARLYERMLEHTLRTATRAGIGQVELWCTPHSQCQPFTKYRDELGVVLRIQRGADLGERMDCAVSDGLQRYSAVIVLGSDCVAMDERYLAAAASGLARADVVLGPAADGGYVLLGMRRHYPALFSGIPWGSSRVLDLSLSILGKKAIRYVLLERLADIDRPEDLASLPSPWLFGDRKEPPVT